MVAWALKKAKLVITVVVGFTVVGIGIAMIFLPGPAIVVIPVGLGILATEFVWARRLLGHVKKRFPRFRRNRHQDASEKERPLSPEGDGF